MCHQSGMSNQCFAFKEFTVYQDKCAMKVGTDGVLLGAWTNVAGMKQILDVGTGTGLIALMLAQRSKAIIDAVEINKESAGQALQNVESSPWADRINVYCTSFQYFAVRSRDSYDLIVSNPPYYHRLLKSPDSARSVARHDTGLEYQDLLFYASRLLTPEGRMNVILPLDMTEKFTDKAYMNDLYLFRMMKIRTVASAKPSRAIMELSRQKQHQPVESLLTVMNEDSRSYTAEYKALTNDYYL